MMEFDCNQRPEALDLSVPSVASGHVTGLSLALRRPVSYCVKNIPRSQSTVTKASDCLKMSCNGCRVLRKGCSDSCILRPCLQWIDSSDAQGHATVFVAKFFGRAGLMGFIGAVPESQRPALFQSLLYEACGRTVNPVFGAVGLLWAGNWTTCQVAVETVLKGGTLRPPSPSSVPSPNLSSLPPGPFLPSLPGLDKSVVARGRESLAPASTYTPPPHMPAEFVPEVHKARLGIGPNQENMQQSGGQEEKDHSSAFRGDVKGDTRQWPEWQHQRMVRVSAPNVNTWPGAVQAVKVPVCPSNQKGSIADTKEVAPVLKREAYTMYEQREWEASYGVQIVAPVPRRMKPRLTQATDEGLVRGLFDDQETAVGSNMSDHLELDLSLKVNVGRGAQTAGLKRVSSPSCDSVNSEGSVTSLDTAPRTVQPPSSWSLQIPVMEPLKRKLLPLLL